MHNLDNHYLDWLFQQNAFPRRESTSIMSGNCKGIALKELFNICMITRSCRVDRALFNFLFNSFETLIGHDSFWSLGYEINYT